MKRRFLSILLVLCMVMTLLPTTAWAADSDFTIENGVLTKYNGSGGDVIIPDGVTSIGDFAFKDCKTLTGIIIPKSTTSIGNWAFSDCSSLINVDIGNSITSIGASAFSNCSSLASLSLPDSVTSIGSWVFLGCNNLKSIIIPNGITDITSGAFSGCSSLTSVVIPNSVTIIGSGAFAGCSSLTSILIPTSVSKISDGAFSDCTSLTSITIPESVSTIEGNDLFYGCSGLTNINLPSHLTTIGSRMFQDCTALTSITIPSSVSIIDKQAFNGCNKLSNIIISNGVISIGDYAFSFCSDLTKLVLPDSVTTIGSHAFQHCTTLTSIVVPDSVTSIGYQPFFNSGAKLSSAGPIGGGFDYEFGWTTEIPDNAFSGCSGLTRVTIPASVTDIGQNAFNGCDGLTDVYYASSRESWALIGGDGKPSNETVTIHYNSTGPDDVGPDNMNPVYFLSGWDATTRTVQFGDEEITPNTYTVADSVDVSNISSLLNKYVLVTMGQGDSSLEYTITDIQPVESRIGTVSATGEHSLTIDGTTYPVRQATIIVSGMYDGKEVLYHVSNETIVDFNALEEKTGTLEAWDNTTGKITIEITAYPTNRTTYPTNYISDLSYLQNLDISSHPKVTYTVAGYFGYQPIIRLSAAPYEPDVSNDYNVPVHELTEEESAKAELWNLLADFNGAYQDFCEAYAQAVIKDAEAQGYDPTGGYTAQVEAMMKADANKKFLTFIEPFDDSLKVYAYRAFCQMIDDAGELNGVDFSSISFSDEFTLGSDVVNQIASQIKSYKETITMGDVEVQIQCGFFFRSDNRLGVMKIRRVTGGPTYSVYLLPNENAAKEAVTQYVAALETLGNKAVKNAYTTVIKELTGLSLSSMNEKAMSEALKRLNNKFSKAVIKGFDVGEVLTVLENCYEQFSECKKLVKMNYSSSMMDTMKSSLEKIVNFDMLNPVDFETTAATKDAAKKLTNIETRLIDALEEYVYTGKISDETLGKINKNPFSWLWSGKCPIEIEVYDDNNNQIGYAGGNIWFTDDILIEKSGEEIRVYSKEPVFVHIIGTDYGMMSFTIEEYADGHPKGRVNYYNVPLKENQTYTVSLASSHLSSVADVIMRDEQGTVVPAFEYISANMDAKVQVTATASSEEAGMLIGDGNYVKGNLVTLTAYANDGYQFVGWFDGNDCVSISSTYAFVAYEDVSLIGQYTGEVFASLITFDPNGGTVSTTTLTTGSDGKLSDLPTATRSDYTFDGWFTSVSGGNKITTDYVFTSDTTVYAHWTKNSGGSSGGGSSSSGGSSSGGSSSTSYSITAGNSAHGSVSVSPKSTSKGTKVTLTIQSDSGYELDSLVVKDTKGNAVKLTKESNTKYTFTMPNSKVTIDATFTEIEQQPSSQIRFTDVSSNAYYYDAVAWAVEQGITSGTTAITFSPNAPCTRAQIVTFLWRAAGSPVMGENNPFTDVTPGSYYYDAVQWAVAQGITVGTSVNTFSPDVTCTRGQAVTLLYRYEKSPAVSGNNAFTDVSDNAYYTNAVQWASMEGVTSGTSTTTFSPDATCTRSQIVTFLYRDMA